MPAQNSKSRTRAFSDYQGADNCSVPDPNLTNSNYRVRTSVGNPGATLYVLSASCSNDSAETLFQGIPAGATVRAWGEYDNGKVKVSAGPQAQCGCMNKTELEPVLGNGAGAKAGVGGESEGLNAGVNAGVNGGANSGDGGAGGQCPSGESMRTLTNDGVECWKDSAETYSDNSDKGIPKVTVPDNVLKGQKDKPVCTSPKQNVRKEWGVCPVSFGCVTQMMRHVSQHGCWIWDGDTK